jgi:hypothetical protein
MKASIAALLSLTCLLISGCGGTDSSVTAPVSPSHNLTLSNNESSNAQPFKTNLDTEARANFNSLSGGRNRLLVLAYDDDSALDQTKLSLQVLKAPISEGTTFEVVGFGSIGDNSLTYNNSIASLLPDGSIDSVTVRQWKASSGEIVMEELTDTSVTVRLVNVRFVLDPLFSGPPNDAEGEFTLNGTVRLPINYS